MGAFPSPPSEIHDLPPQVQAYAQAAVLADNTRAAYWGDLRRFMDWGGVVPASSKTVASYLVAHANSHKYATLARWKVSIGKSHTAKGLPDPTKTELVHAVLKGIKQKHGQDQRQVAPLTKEKIISMVSNMGDRLKDKRDKALILVGFAGGLRRSDLISLKREDLSEKEDGWEIILSKSQVGIPKASGQVCAAKALKEWLEVSEITEGAVFQGINRHGKRSGKPLTGHGVALIVKERVQSIGLDPAHYSGFSLRAGLISSSADQGISLRHATSLNGNGVL
ncbi:MAG: tyrosine-type recombinase/integrase [Magnetococcales bacterium]|nr:tyrosine-type recombinase/integrase [Magnetococcales bacterium]